MERYTKVKPIGSGTFGQAWLVESVVSLRKYALKELGVASMSEQDRHLALNEAKILSKLKHKNIVRYKEAFVAQGKLCIAMEFAEKGDLYTRIRERNGTHFTEMQVLEWFTQLCLALKYIHGQNILHRDLKTQNIFLSKDDVIKLGDFGIARTLNSSLDHAQTTVGTPYYLSPEICQRKPYNHKSDMWSLGCVLYEMATLKHAFNANNFSALVIKILQGQYPPIPRCYGPLLEDLVSVLLQKNPEDRPSAKQLLYVPAMQPYVKRFLMSERERTDSVASDISDISSRPGPDCSQISSSSKQGKTADTVNTAVSTPAHVSHNFASSTQADRETENPTVFAGGSRVNSSGERKLSSTNNLKARKDSRAFEGRSKEQENLAAFVNSEKGVNILKTREYVRAGDNGAKSRQNIPVSENLLKLREKLRTRYSVSTRKNSLAALAHVQHRRRYSERTSVCQEPGTRILKKRMLSQGVQFGEISEADDDVFAKNQATVIPARSSNTNKATNRREFNKHDVNANHSTVNKLTRVVEQKRQEPALSVCRPQCSEDMRTRKRHQSAVTFLDRNCWPAEQKHRRLSSRSGNDNKDKENRRFVTAHAQVTAKRRASSGALKPIQASDEEKQQPVKPGSGTTGNKRESRKRTFTVSYERKLSDFEIPKIEGEKHCNDDSRRCEDGNESCNRKNGSCKNANGTCKSTNGRESVRFSYREKRQLDCESEEGAKLFKLEREEQINSSERQNILHLSPKPSDSQAVNQDVSKPSCKFTFCGKTLHLDDVSSHDSVYAHMEALRMHLEKKLGTRLLTAVYRYVTNVSVEEDERIRQTVKCMLGEQNMVYFPVLLQLVACEAIYFY